MTHTYEALGSTVGEIEHGVAEPDPIFTNRGDTPGCVRAVRVVDGTLEAMELDPQQAGERSRAATTTASSGGGR